MLRLDQLAQFHEQFKEFLNLEVASFELRGRKFRHYPDTELMGVVNLSTDSSYRESIALSTEAAIRRGRRLFAEGAAIVDIGPESSVSGRAKVEVPEQIRKLLPVVEALSDDGGIVSVDTYDFDVAKACLKAGARVINLSTTQDLIPFYDLVAEHESGVVICFIQGARGQETDRLTLEGDHLGRVIDHLAKEVESATQAGVSRIWVDQGLGFSYRNLRNAYQSAESETIRIRYLMNSLLTSFRLRSLGWPVLQQPPLSFNHFEDEVRSGEAFYSVFALLGQVDLLRTHEVNKLRGVLGAMSHYHPE